MSQIKLQAVYKVEIIESEAGWGSKVDDTLYFDNEAEARLYVKEYNNKWNNSTEVPAWYMAAQYCGKV